MSDKSERLFQALSELKDSTWARMRSTRFCRSPAV